MSGTDKLGPSSPEDQGTKPLISVVICTHNRVRYLRSAIDSVLRQNFPTTGYELIVVDNGSTDETAAVCNGLNADERLRYIYEARLGLCHARNRGWHEARGTYVAYLDDDAIADPEWLASIAEGFAFLPDVGIVGGPVEPIWEAHRPEWISDGIASSLTILDWGRDLKRIADVRWEWLVGANMATRATILSEIGGFDPRLGRAGTNMLSGEDVFLQKQILELGYNCVYHPGMAVRHLIQKERLQKQWFRRRYYWQGVSDAVMELITDRPSTAGRVGRGLARLCRLLLNRAMLWALILPAKGSEQFQSRCFAFIEIGHIAGLLGVARA